MDRCISPLCTTLLVSSLAMAACTSEPEGSENPPALLSAVAHHVQLSRIDGVPWVRVELELEAEADALCNDADDPTRYGIFLDPDLSFDTIAEEEVFGLLNPTMQISASCQGGELVSEAGPVTLSAGEAAGSTRLTIDARSEELPHEFHWVAFVASRQTLQRVPTSPGVEVASIAALETL